MGDKYCGKSLYLWRYSHFPTFFVHKDTEFELFEMKIGGAGPMFCDKNIKVSMGKRYKYSTRW